MHQAWIANSIFFCAQVQNFTYEKISLMVALFVLLGLKLQIFYSSFYCLCCLLKTGKFNYVKGTMHSLQSYSIFIGFTSAGASIQPELSRTTLCWHYVLAQGRKMCLKGKTCLHKALCDLNSLKPT